ncbi:MAG: WecB/TagA/CpsF family glycosyltransferase, partial [Actinomycetota bacterium]
MTTSLRSNILGVPLARLDPQGALSEIERLYDSPEPCIVVHANAHTLNLAATDPSYKPVLARADLILNDGKGVMLASRLLGEGFPADLNGNYFGPLLLQRAADRGWSVFLFGARPGVVDQAARTMTGRCPRLKIVGIHHGYVAADEEESLNERIRASGAQLLLVALGNPLQERWLDRNLVRTGARLGVGVGAFFDFQAGAMKRAPDW